MAPLVPSGCSSVEMTVEPLQWTDALFARATVDERRTYLVAPSNNREPLTGAPIYRPPTMKLPKESKREKLAKRIDNALITETTSPMVNATEHYPRVGCEAHLSFAHMSRPESNYGPHLPSPNLFLANMVNQENSQFENYQHSCFIAASKLLDQIWNDENGPSTRVVVGAIMVPEAAKANFFNVSVACRPDLDPQPTDHQRALGSAFTGCSCCRFQQRQNYMNNVESRSVCYAQLAVLKMCSMGPSIKMDQRIVRVSPSLSLLDGISTLTAIYAQLVTIGGAKVLHDEHALGTVSVMKANDLVRAGSSHQPEDIALTAHVKLPDSFNYVKQYVTCEEERDLMELLTQAPTIEGNLKRRVVHYGYAFDYHIQQIDPTKKLEMPPKLKSLAERLYIQGLVPEMPDQITLNEYISGQGIGHHIDVHATFTSWIASLSLGSACVMEFRQLETEGSHIPATRSTLQDNGELPPAGVPSFFKKPKVLNRKLVQLEPRSLTIFSDELRYAWQHCIPSRKSDCIDGIIVPRQTRISVTFRKIRDPSQSQCPCDFEYYCDQKNPATYLNLLPTRLAGKGSQGAQSVRQVLENINSS